MTKIVNTNEQEVFNRFDLNSWSTQERLTFLEQAIEIRVKHLLDLIDPNFIASVTTVNRWLRVPLSCQKELEHLKNTYDIQSEVFHSNLEKIEHNFFSAIN